MENLKINKNILEETLEIVAEKLGAPAKNTILFENRGKHLFEIKTILENTRNGKLLDIGGGLGVNFFCLHNLKKNNFEFTLIDRFEEYDDGNRMGSINSSANLVKEANINIVNQDFWQNKKLPFQDNYFDLVSILDVTEHLPGNPLYLLKETYRILKPGGLLFLGGPSSITLLKRIRMLFGRNPYINLQTWLDDKYFFHYREYSKYEQEELIKLSNLKLIKTYMLAEPSNTQVKYRFYYDEKKKLSIKTIILYLMDIIERLIPNLRAAVYCIAKK
ncbi:MAG: class I SAM-dependent methyltransferase [Candidatus Humimicrobiaceae bacterium]